MAPRIVHVRRRQLPFAPLLLFLLAGADALLSEVYTTNAVCSQRYCVNPVFPAIEQMPTLEQLTWRKQPLHNVSELMSFCGQVLNYDPALPQLSGRGNETAEVRRLRLKERSERGLPVTEFEASGPLDALRASVAELDRAAARRYFLHLSGMGIEAWDHTEPMKASSHPLRPCARSVAELVCFTYFPQAPVHLAAGEEAPYLRPCRSSCQTYLDACGVECCDEGVVCVWGPSADGPVSAEAERRARPAKTIGLRGEPVVLEVGYVDHDGPSAYCTGGVALSQRHDP